ncbi:U3 small nucleolar RNA-associated 21 homolog [Olea europaea subsp. europaea]|uniref:U3 small nucleolar RNA-associated 21 homolog n=1 Tax=Olea europaea subsp. europaea TaxID=158383 RepID=A0A8S0SD88_OLEEU|nr:U3 small nucleolar RNA-associated 21 homolog [Olea europaea subsp. europaea]
MAATWSSHNAKVNHLLIFGENGLSADVEGNIFIFAFKGMDESLAPTGHILLENSCPSCIMHPDTYLYKKIVGTQEGSVTALSFSSDGQPLLASGSLSDNFIKMWIFDTGDGDPPLLRFRSGQNARPLCIGYYSNGLHILSAGEDHAFRLFSIARISKAESFLNVTDLKEQKSSVWRKQK